MQSNNPQFNLDLEWAKTLKQLDKLTNMYITLKNEHGNLPYEKKDMQKYYDYMKEKLSKVTRKLKYSDEVKKMMFEWESDIIDAISERYLDFDPSKAKPYPSYDSAWIDNFNSLKENLIDFQISMNNIYKKNKHIPQDKLDYFYEQIIKLDLLSQLHQQKATGNVEMQAKIVNEYNKVIQKSSQYEVANNMPLNISRLKETLSELSAFFDIYLQVNSLKDNPYLQDLTKIKDIKSKLESYYNILKNDPTNNSKLDMDNLLRDLKNANILISDVNKKIINALSERITPLIDKYFAKNLQKSGEREFSDSIVYGESVYLVKNTEMNRVSKKINKKDTVKLKTNDKYYQLFILKGALDELNAELKSNPHLQLTSNKISRLGHLDLKVMLSFIEKYDEEPKKQINLASSSSLVESSLDSSDSSLVGDLDSESKSLKTPLKSEQLPEITITANKSASQTFASKNKKMQIELVSIFYHSPQNDKIFENKIDKNVKLESRTTIGLIEMEEKNNQLTKTYSVKAPKSKAVEVKNDIKTEKNKIESTLSNIEGIAKLGPIQQAEVAKLWLEDSIRKAIKQGLIRNTRSANITINFGSLSKNKEFMKTVALLCHKEGYTSFLTFNPPPKQLTKDDIANFNETYKEMKKLTIQDVTSELKTKSNRSLKK